MKLNSFYLPLLALGMVLLSACSDDDDKIPAESIPTAVADSFKARYPDINITSVKWETKGAYTVGEFKKTTDSEDIEAWFTTATGEWKMTETDYGKNLFLIPVEISNAFGMTEYGSLWTIDDICLYEYTDASKNFYLFEVEKAGQQDMEIYFRTDGSLIKAIPDTNRDITPDTVI